MCNSDMKRSDSMSIVLQQIPKFAFENDSVVKNNYILIVNVLTKYTTQACNPSFGVSWYTTDKYSIQDNETKAGCNKNDPFAEIDIKLHCNKHRTIVQMCKKSVRIVFGMSGWLGYRTKS